MQPSTLERSHITLRRSVAERNRWCGICVEDADLVIEDSVSRDTLAQASDGAFGFGVRAFNYSNAAPVAPALDISRSLIERSRLIGMAVVGADATASRLVIRDIAPRVSDDRMGRPISVEPSQATKRPAHIDLTGARLERGYESGMMIIGATANIDSVLVSSIAPHAINDSFGVGIAYVRDIFNGIDTGGAVTNTVVEDVHTVGIAALGANVGISNTITRNVQPEFASGDFGDGIIASEWIFVLELFEASMTVDRVTVEDSARAGIVAFSAEVSVADSALECNVIQLDKEPVLDGSPIFEDRGGNHCGCAEASEACKVLTSNIEPPQPPT
jgi:hypothetical protein